MCADPGRSPGQSLQSPRHVATAGLRGRRASPRHARYIPPAMKYAIIIPDGAADEPLAELGGKTPIEAAQTPNMDRVAAEGRQGLVRTVPEGFESGSDVATMTLLGYDPAVYHTGRAPLEAAAQRIPLDPTDWVFRCNLVTTSGGIMKDHSAGGIDNVEARQLLVDLA